MSNELEEILFKAGTILKYQGLPFELKKDTVLLGRQTNKDLADKSAKERRQGDQKCGL